MSTEVCHIFVVRVPERSAVYREARCMVSGEVSATSNDRYGFIYFWIFANKPLQRVFV